MELTTIIITALVMSGVVGGFVLAISVSEARFKERELNRRCGLPGQAGTKARKEREALRGPNDLME